MSSKTKKVQLPSYNYEPVVALAHTPPYKIHKYFARRPYNVFEQLVLNFSKEGDLVLDPFCGGGVTVYESLRKNRRVIGCDLNPLSIFINENMIKRTPVDDEFLAVFEDVKNYIKYLTGDYLKFKKDGLTYDVSWAELATTVKCPVCGKPTPLSNDLKIKPSNYKCKHLACSAHEAGYSSKNCEKLGTEILYLVHSSKNSVVVKELDSLDEKAYEDHISFLKKEMTAKSITVPQDKIPMDWDRQFEDGLFKKGYIYFQDLFTKRNLYILLLVKHFIDAKKEELGQERYELLRLAFSNILKDTNVMSFTNDGWQGGKPTTWSKHAYWIPNQYCEVPILMTYDKCVERILAALRFNAQQTYEPNVASTFDDLAHGKNVWLVNLPVNQANLEDESIDAIITDPPYGSNVQYLELSHFWYPWNKDLYDKYPVFELEAISNRKKGFKGAKDQYTYENNLYSVFQSGYSALKPGGYMVMTFNNKDMSAWLALLLSIFRSGFSFEKMYFQDGVKNYKQTSHTKAKGSPFGDFIYVFKKSDPTYDLVTYASEDAFKTDLENIFTPKMENVEDRNEAIVDMFTAAIPLIDGFAKTYLMEAGKHNLYDYFKKNFLDKLYENE